jgi:hypothetical protein
MNDYQKAEQAKAVLKSLGYQTDNLWHIDDVKADYDCSDEDAQSILTKALTNDATYEQIWLAIQITAEDSFGLERKVNS